MMLGGFNYLVFDRLSRKIELVCPHEEEGRLKIGLMSKEITDQGPGLSSMYEALMPDTKD
jgi:hypothetical protein